MKPDDEGVVASALEIIEIAEVMGLLKAAPGSFFTPAEQGFASSKSDPERRLAARLAAKRATARLLGGAVTPGDVEVVRDPAGPPRLSLSPRAKARLHELGAARTLVSLTHDRSFAAASVVLLRGER